MGFEPPIVEHLKLELQAGIIFPAAAEAKRGISQR
jgi:hypothetical protein